MWVRGGVLILAIGMVFALAGCGGQNDEDAASSGAAAPSESYESLEAEYDAADAMDVDADTDRSGVSTIGAGTIDRRVIRSADLELSVTDVDAAVRFARDLATEFDGYVESSSARTLSEGDEIADLTLEVPSNTFDDVIDRLRTGPHVVEVEWESTSSRDVTEEFVDLNAQLTNLQSTEQRFVELLDAASTIDEILRVEGEISRTRGDIERIQGRLNYLEQRTDYSRIFVKFALDDDEGITVAGQNFTPGQTASEAWDASMRFMGTVGNAVVAVVVFFWWAWPLAGILSVLGVHYARRRKAPLNPEPNPSTN